MRRKTYLLLELLIAFTLLSLCALPLVRNPMHAAKQELLSFEQMELQRLAELTFASILEKFYRNEIAWDDFASPKISETPLYAEKCLFNLSDFMKRTYDKKIFIWTKAHKIGPEKEEVRLAYIKVVFQAAGKGKAKTFDYRVLLEKKNSSSPTEFRRGG